MSLHMVGVGVRNDGVGLRCMGVEPKPWAGQVDAVSE